MTSSVAIRITATKVAVSPPAVSDIDVRAPYRRKHDLQEGLLVSATPAQ